MGNTNSYYNRGADFNPDELADGDSLESELDAIQRGFKKVEETNAPIASPTFTGIPAVPTAEADTSTTQAASTAFVVGQAATASPAMDGTAAVGTSKKFARQDHVHPTDTSRAPIASPTFTGTPAAPTAVAGTNTTQLATTEFVMRELAADGFKTTMLGGCLAVEQLT